MLNRLLFEVLLGTTKNLREHRLYPMFTQETCILDYSSPPAWQRKKAFIPANRVICKFYEYCFSSSFQWCSCFLKYSPEERKYLLHYAAGCGDLAMVAERADKIMAEQYGINYGGLSPAYKRNRRKNHRNVSDYIVGAIPGMARMYGIIRLSHWGNTRYQVLNPGWDYHIYLYDGAIRDVSPRNYYLKTYEDALRTVRSYGDLQTNIPMEFHSNSQLVEQINIIYREHCSVV